MRHPTLQDLACPKRLDRGIRAYVLGCLSIGIIGCAGGSGEDLNIAGRPLSEAGEIAPAATLESIQANIFDPFCTVCHSGASAPQGLRLDAANSFSNLVGAPSNESSLLRVSPGEPDQSYLIRKLEGSASEGDQMPLGGPPIPQASIDYVRQWIIDGAPEDSGNHDSDLPAVVTSFTPEPNMTISQLPREILAGFSQDIDFSTVNSLSIQLFRSGGDNTFIDGNEALVEIPSIQLSDVNPRLLILDLAGTEPVEDRYRVILKGTGPNVILDVNGRALDGEFTGAFPSGDGTEGGDFVIEFQLQGIQATLQSIQDNVFTPVCAICHTGPEGPALPSGQDLSSSAASFASLVNIPSIEQPAIRRVAIGDADNSYLIQKLEGTAAVGSQMPAGGPFLDQATIDVIRSWIDQGANP